MLMLTSILASAQQTVVTTYDSYEIGEIQLDANRVETLPNQIAYIQEMLPTWRANATRQNAELRALQPTIDRLDLIFAKEVGDRTSAELQYIEQFGRVLSDYENLSKFSWQMLFDSKDRQLTRLQESLRTLPDSCVDWNEGETKQFYSTVVFLPSVCTEAVNNNGDVFSIEGNVKVQGRGYSYEGNILTITNEDFYIKIEGYDFTVEKKEGGLSEFIIAL